VKKKRKTEKTDLRVRFRKIGDDEQNEQTDRESENDDIPHTARHTARQQRASSWSTVLYFVKKAATAQQVYTFYSDLLVRKLKSTERY
jgi:glutamate synthase domain-containing protein 1